MIEFSLLELREFISISTTNGLSFTDYSFISLRLALQRTCEDFKIKDFLDFVRQFQQRNEVKKALQLRILSQPKDLLRDVANWQYVIRINEALLSDPTKSVLIIDNNFGSDITSFLILCRLLKIPLSCKLEWYSFCGSFVWAESMRFSGKDLEIAQSNFQSNTVRLLEHFTLKLGDYYFNCEYSLGKAEINLDEQSIIPLKNSYDLIISQNNSLKFNFGGHDRFFKACLSVSKKNGGLFFGARENLKQSSCFSQLKQQHKDLNYFINEKGYY